MNDNFTDIATFRFFHFFYWALLALGPILLVTFAVGKLEEKINLLLKGHKQTSSDIFSIGFLLPLYAAWALIMLLPASISTVLTVHGLPEDQDFPTFLLESVGRWVFMISFLAAFGLSSMVVIAVFGDRGERPIFIPIIGAFALLLFVSSLFYFLIG